VHSQSCTLLFLFLTAIVFIIFATSSNECIFITLCFPILLVLFILSIVVSFIYQKAYYRAYFYYVTDGFLIIKKGVIIPKETTLPFEKINDIYVDQDLLDKAFGLFDVHFSTATVESGLHAHIDGLTTENAKKLKTIILQAIKESLDA